MLLKNDVRNVAGTSNSGITNPNTFKPTSASASSQQIVVTGVTLEFFFFFWSS